MGRTKGSKDTKPRAARGTAPKGPTITDHAASAANDVPLTDEQKRALLLQAIPKWEKADKAVKDAAAARLALGREFKADRISLADVKLALRLRTPEGEAKVKAELEAMVQTAAWVGADIGTQFTLFRDDAEDGEDASYRAGYQVGAEGGSSAKIPRKWDVNKWMEGYNTAQAHLGSQFKQKQENADAEFDSAAPGDEATPTESPATAGADNDF